MGGKDLLLQPICSRSPLCPCETKEGRKMETSRWTVDIKSNDLGDRVKEKKKAPDDNCSLFYLCIFTPSGPRRSAGDNA